MAAPTITALYGALNAMFNIFLANRVSTLRRKVGASVGDRGDKELQIAIRMHGNNAEFVPLAIVMMLIAELLGGASLPLHLYGGGLLLARLTHAIGLPRKSPNPFRVGGTAITWGAIVAMSGWVLYLRGF